MDAQVSKIFKQIFHEHSNFLVDSAKIVKVKNKINDSKRAESNILRRIFIY